MAGCWSPNSAPRWAARPSFPTPRSATKHHLRRGYWEAKDTDDKLDSEIKKKIGKGYPLTNTIFEDTRQAVLL
jgi:hypothetical protein